MMELGEGNYLQDRDSLYCLSHGFHCWIEQKFGLRVTHFLLGVLSTLIECSSNVGWVSDFLGTFSTTGIPKKWSNLVGAVFVGMV